MRNLEEWFMVGMILLTGGLVGGTENIPALQCLPDPVLP